MCLPGLGALAGPGTQWQADPGALRSPAPAAELSGAAWQGPAHSSLVMSSSSRHTARAACAGRAARARCWPGQDRASLTPASLPGAAAPQGHCPKTRLRRAVGRLVDGTGCAGRLTHSCFPGRGPRLTVGLRLWARCCCQARCQPAQLLEDRLVVADGVRRGQASQSTLLSWLQGAGCGDGCGAGGLAEPSPWGLRPWADPARAGEVGASPSRGRLGS